MEVGAVKHALNNEIILLKKKLNQARTQTINKLTRKIKILRSRKGPDKDKFTRKAENFLLEVTLLKKIKAKNLVRFAIICNGDFQSYISRQNVDEERAMARLLQHKSLIDKAEMLKDTFGNMPADQLLMTRKERLQLKKQQKLKSQDKNKNKTETNGAGKFEEETISEDNNFVQDSDIESDNSYDSNNDEEPRIEDKNEQTEARDSNSLINSGFSKIHGDSDIASLSSDKEVVSESDDLEGNETSEEFDEPSSDNEETTKGSIQQPGQFVLRKPNDQNDKGDTHEHFKEGNEERAKLTNDRLNKVSMNKLKQTKKKTIKERNKKFEIPDVREDELKPEAIIVDPFFITSTGENYKTLVEPRMPDVIKDDNTHANRRMRRAAMFGRPIKPFITNKETDKRKGFKGQPYNKEFRDDSQKLHAKFGQNDSTERYNNIPFRKTNIPEKNSVLDKRKADVKDKKLHPSWEAKKQKSGIVAFQGKKVVFNNDD